MCPRKKTATLFLRRRRRRRTRRPRRPQQQQQRRRLCNAPSGRLLEAHYNADANVTVKDIGGKRNTANVTVLELLESGSKFKRLPVIKFNTKYKTIEELFSKTHSVHRTRSQKVE